MLQLSPVIISRESQSSLLDYAQKILGWHKTCGQFRNKMDQIDISYARYQEALARGNKDGVDRFGAVECGVGANRKEVVNPIVISTVESVVAYWSEVFLSGYPRFPVVATPDKREQAEGLEGILQDHVTLSQSDAELQILLKDLGKYNLGVVEIDWAPLSTYQLEIPDPTVVGEKREQSYDSKHINYIRRWNLRNTFFDPLVDPVQVARDGEFIGHTEVYNRVKLKRLLNYLTNEKKLVHSSVVNKAMESRADSTLWVPDPTISPFMTGSKETNDYDSWCGFAPPVPDGMIKVPYNGQGVYYISTIYIRAIPTDFLLNVPNKNSPQIWKLLVVNGNVLISAEKLNTAYDMFPVYIGHAFEDGMGLQTQSYAEMAMPIQEATTRLFNIRFQAANRAIQDRGLFNPSMIRASDINSPIPSAKIAVQVQALAENGGLDQAYRPIPFDGRGTEGVLQDAILINDWSKELTGQNNASRGQFQKGNKTMAEFDTIMSNSDNRSRLSALIIAQRIFGPMKEQLKLNILQYGDDTEIISPRSSKPLSVVINDLIQSSLQFELADGYTPKSKLANTDFMLSLINLISTSPYLQQVYGQQLPGVVAHLAQLGGVRGFDQYAQAAIDQYGKQVEFQQQLMQTMQQLQQSMTQGQQSQEAGQVA